MIAIIKYLKEKKVKYDALGSSRITKRLRDDHLWGIL